MPNKLVERNVADTPSLTHHRRENEGRFRVPNGLGGERRKKVGRRQMRMIETQFRRDPLAGTFVAGLLAMGASGLVFLAGCFTGQLEIVSSILCLVFMILMAISSVFTSCVAIPNYPWCAVQATRALQGKHYGKFVIYSTLTLLSGAVTFVAILYISVFIGVRM